MKLTKPYEPNFYGEARALASDTRCPSIRVIGVVDDASETQKQELADFVGRHYPGDEMDAMIKQGCMDGAIVRLSGRDYQVIGKLILCVKGRGNGH